MQSVALTESYQSSYNTPNNLSHSISHVIGFVPFFFIMISNLSLIDLCIYKVQLTKLFNSMTSICYDFSGALDFVVI